MIWLKPLSYIFKVLTKCRNFLFDKHILKVHSIQIPVVSVGNLTMGGTGKTPFVDFLIKYFLARQKKTAVVSRAYKAKAVNPIRVVASQELATKFYGDEPVWLALNNPKASIFCGQSKWQIADWASRQDKFDIFILDDGFQHRYLKREFDFVILDATEDPRNYQIVPEGRARESFESLGRAQVVVLSKCNWTSDSQLQWLRSQIPSDKKIIEMHSVIKNFLDYNNSKIAELNSKNKGSALLFCSIAKPDLFIKMLEPYFSKIEILAFPDHHQFLEDDIESILQKKNVSKLDFICCTEKDAVKLKALWPRDEGLLVSQLGIQIIKGEEVIDEIFDQLFS